MSKYKSMTRTELLKELDRLLASEEQHRSMVENVIDGFYRGDMDGFLTFASPSVARIFGYSGPEEMIGRKISETFYHDPEERDKVLKRLMEEKVITCYRATLKRKDGTPFTAETNSRVVFDAHGAPIGVEGVFSNITERLQIEEKLRQSEYYYRMLFETTGAATGIVSEDSVIRRCNSQFARLSGCSKEDIENRKVWSDFVAPQDRERMRSYHEARKASDSSPPREYDFIFQDAQGGHKNVHVVLEVLEGSKDRIVSVLDITERVKAEEALRKSEERYRRLAITDGLTGLYNRRHFFSLAEKEVERARRHHTGLAVIMLDIDHFKQINDRYGHDVGDKVLQMVAGHLQSIVRTVDVIARYGGEEFLLLLPESTVDDARHVAERLREELSSHTFEQDGGSFNLTASFGVNSLQIQETVSRAHSKLIERMVKGADEALYQSKHAGRNRVTVACR